MPPGTVFLHRRTVTVFYRLHSLCLIDEIVVSKFWYPKSKTPQQASGVFDTQTRTHVLP